MSGCQNAKTWMVAAVAVAANIGLAGCASPYLVLLDDEGGGNGAVAVLETKNQAGDFVVTTSNSRTSLNRINPVSKPLGKKGLNQRQRQLIETLPPQAATFVIYFVEGTTTPAAGSENIINLVRENIAARSGAEVQVTGHTDTVGNDDDNDRLSLQRATSIAASLMEQGFDAEALSAVGRGERQLLQPTADNIANAANRRVEIIVR